MSSVGRLRSASQMIFRVCSSSSPTSSRRGGRTRALPTPSSDCTSLISWTKRGNGIQAQQRQEPAIQLKGFFALAVEGIVEQFDRLPRQSIGETRNPPRHSDRDAFDHGVVDPDENLQAIAHQGANRGHAPHVGARFLHRFKVVILGSQLLNP